MKSYKNDILGLISASFCVVHCAAMPFLLFVLASVEWLPMAAYVFFCASLYAALEATKHSQNPKIIALIWTSLFFLLVSIVFEEDHENLHYLNYAASVGLIVGHIWNIRYCKKCNHNP